MRLAGRLQDGRSFAAVIDADARRKMALFSGSGWVDWEGRRFEDMRLETVAQGGWEPAIP